MTAEIFAASDIAIRGTQIPSVKLIMEWLLTYIVEPHKELGRSGPVCPFVPSALTHRALWISVVERKVRTVAEIVGILESYVECYPLYEPTGVGKDLTSIVIGFPTLHPEYAGRVIEDAHKAVKPRIVQAGLMLGEFHATHSSPGVHNPRFRPLRSPIPLFVLRKMISNDIVFLNKASDPPERRALFIRAYLNAFKHVMPAKALDTLHADLAELEARIELGGVA